MGGPGTVLQDFYDHFGDGDLDGAVSVFATDVRLIDPGVGDVEGQAAVRSYLAGLKEAVPDARAVVQRGFEIGTTAIVEGRFTGTGPAADPPGAATTAAVVIDLPFADFAVIRDGRIAEYRTYYDQVSLLTQLGQLT
jgi:ketosteroid isomerase-like protein